jgi:hypothetical protein
MKFELKRMNFFKGLFTRAEDWLAEQNYYLEKHKLHNRGFHTPGVVTGELQNLKVTVEDDNLVVKPGYAVDGYGRDLYLPEQIEPRIPPSQGDKQIYVYIAFGQQPVDKRENHLNPDLTDYAFVLERPNVECTEQEPDNIEKIELARIKLRSEQPITADRIDTRHVRRAGTRRAGTGAVLVLSGDIGVEPSQGMQFSETDVKVWIESREGEAFGVYVGNAFPDQSSAAADARIFWRIESSITPERKVGYYLLLKNFGNTRVKVHYQVYRLDFGQGG